MTGDVQFQLIEFTHMSYGSLTCSGRCIRGELRVGDPVQLISFDGPIYDNLTVSRIERYGERPFLDLGMSAHVTVTGSGDINVKAIRAALSTRPADVMLVAAPTAGGQPGRPPA
ncbi:hypothetical protein Aab01nite_12570 [Paractinoplanes abujensis]|uniref:Uncharacterized protein n=1 Tax=Paractinoplanes abujensis TaxID=882441 RepID=A0A7W7CPH7_9ACTN|nr:hypothetical protein [Actinoplanes abujensis]MBB4690920.1 hypothetical protein [Actinoplanes abujensis]GID17667.1 hypothetical protein Aab01nite_12570 [Actinoplanes abujensis]